MLSWWRLVLVAGRNEERGEDREREPQFHNFLGRSLHCFYFNASGGRNRNSFSKDNCPAMPELVAVMESERNVLIVDDDATSRALLTRMLSASGYLCRETDTASDALKAGA